MSYNCHVCGPMKILDSVTHEDASSAALIISQVEGQAYDLGTSKNVKSSGGQVRTTFSGILGQTPKFALSTEALAQFLTAVGCEGLALSTGVELYNTLVDTATGGRKSGANHEKIAFVACLIVPRQISCSHLGIAKLSFDIFGVSSDGTTHPITITGSVSLPTIAGVSEQFTLGPIKINGTAYEGIQDLTIDFGLSEVLRSGGADVYTRLAYFAQIKPKITIKTDDSAVLAALTKIGTAANSGGTSVIYLCQCAKNGVRVANATAAHISFTVYDGIWLPTEKGGSHPGQLTTGFEIEPTYDGTHAPLVLNAAVAIS